MIGNKPSKKKTPFPVSKDFNSYLEHYDRTRDLPVTYKDLLRFNHSIPLLDQEGNDTLWNTVLYPSYDMDELNEALTTIYAMLKNDGDSAIVKHLGVARVDFCGFGNTQPFRIRIINRLNDNYDHFYVKKADSSRVFGLELEHILSPNKIIYFIDDATLIEEHIAGVPGDDFIATRLNTSSFNQIRIAKEFVKFNERCFVRLLGDMRAYNYVVDITPDIEGEQFRIRAIDFDQQSYEGRKSFYLPQYFKENNPIIFLGVKHMTPETVTQYQHEERSMISVRIKSAGSRLDDLLYNMKKDKISTPEKVNLLKFELAQHHSNDLFHSCRTMGEVVAAQIQLMLDKTFRQGIRG